MAAVSVYLAVFHLSKQGW